MRSPREIAFRLRQEAANLVLAALPPASAIDVRRPFSLFPDPSSVARRLKGTSFARDVETIAEKVLQHRFPVLGFELTVSGEFPWRKDLVHGHTAEIAYLRKIPYLTFESVGDHKITWEPNRHQHFVLLAQAYLFTGRKEFVDEIVRQWEHWIADNPFHRSINWTSALEVAFRSLSWLWTLHLAGDRIPADARKRFVSALYQHGCHLQYNLSHYFSPNTHLLGEAVALHAIGALIPEFSSSRHWRTTGAEIVLQELTRQVRPDGAHFEQSTYYHVYALDFFLLHWILAGKPDAYREPLRRMADYLHAVLGPARRIPLMGDDDGGRLFHPYGIHDQYGRATLATTSAALNERRWDFDPEDFHPQADWWLDTSSWNGSSHRAGHPSKLFPDIGTAVLTSSELWVAADAGGFGPFRAGHSHSDTLSFTARHNDCDLLVDSGTYTYVGDPQWRDWFRGSAAHNTIRVDGFSQAVPRDPFGWQGKPIVTLNNWITNDEYDYMDATCRYDGSPFVHRRRLLLSKPGLMLILDNVEGSEGEHLVEQFWHPGGELTQLSDHCFALHTNACLLLPTGAAIKTDHGNQHGWRSNAYGVKQAAPVLIVQAKTSLPVHLGAALAIGPADRFTSLVIEPGTGAIRFILNGTEQRQIDFPENGVPVLSS